jgi:hypothetical protein
MQNPKFKPQYCPKQNKTLPHSSWNISEFKYQMKYHRNERKMRAPRTYVSHRNFGRKQIQRCLDVYKHSRTTGKVQKEREKSISMTG